MWRVCCDSSKQVPEKQCGGFVVTLALVSAQARPRETVWRVCCDLSSSECIKQVPEKQCGGFVVTLALVSASNKSQRNSVEGLL